MIPSQTSGRREEALPGGVSSDIRVVREGSGAYVIKRALPKLRVKADWFSDPSRSANEVDALRVMRELVGREHVPEVLWSDPASNEFAMDLVEPRFLNWKAELMAGKVEVRTARAAGTVLGRLHGRSAIRPDVQHRFADVRFFEELRIAPYFRRISAINGYLASAVEDVITGMDQRRACLVHGDFSPKNILADGAEIVVLDCEVAHWGDPRFDLAFCLTHLVLKALRRRASASKLLASALALLSAYRSEGPDIIDADLVRVLACLLIARLEGDSPVEYLDDLDTAHVKQFSERWLLAPMLPLEALLEAVMKRAP